MNSYRAARSPSTGPVTARDIVRAHRGDWCGSYGLVPGPGHSPKDRSLKVWQDGDRVFVHSFAGDDWRACRAYLGLADEPSRVPVERPKPAPARPTRRVRDLLRTSTSPDLVPDVVAYLQHRRLWPLPPGCGLKAHAAADYWDAGDPPVLVGKFPALVAEVHDITGGLVSAHVTYLENGRKLEARTPRKLLGPTTGRTGCAVRLFPLAPRLAVAEGIETAIAASRVLGLPCWSCISTALLQAFQPPAHVERLVIAADKDVPGLIAAWKLRDRLNLPMDLALPRGADFADFDL